MRKYLFIILVVISFTAGCTDISGDKSAEKQPGKSRFLIVNGEEIYKEDFLDHISFELKEMDEDARNNLEVKENLVKNYVIHRLLLQEAAKKNIVVDKDRIERVMKSFNTLRGRSTLKEIETTTSLSEAKLKKQLTERMTVDKLLESVISVDIDIDEATLKEYFKENYSDQKPQKRAHILHILTYDKGLAIEAMDDLKAGISFAETAEKYSVAPERNSGGDLGFINEQDTPDIFKKAFTLKENQLSEIIQSEYGYHIFKVLKYEKVPKVTYDTAKKRLYIELYAYKQQELVREYIDELYENATIVTVGTVDFNIDNNSVESGDNK